MEYSYDDGSRLRQVLRNGKLFGKYSYDYNRLLSIEDGDGHELLVNQYYDNYRLKQLSLADGSTWRFSYAYDKKYNVTAVEMIDLADHHRRIPVTVTRQEKEEE